MGIGGLSISMTHTGPDCQTCIRLLMDSDGLIVNRIMLEPDAEYDPAPLIVAPSRSGWRYWRDIH